LVESSVCQAINKYLADLPVPFVLETGSIGKVSARIPWPNLLTAPLALSLSSLSLTFVHSPRVNLSGHPHSTDDLMESVASMAESFVQDELSARESEALQHELNVDHPARHQPPGSIDPFLSTEDLDSRSRVNLYDDDDGDEAMDKIDPSTQGVSIVATLIERLLARFEFDASDLTIRLILPKKAGFTFHLGQLTYNTEITPDTPSSDRENDEGEVRVVKLSKITISTHDIKPQPSPLSTASRQRSASPDASSSSSEDNEESMMMMSQSLACLPPPPSTRSVSPESSMYHSATTSVRSPSPETLSDTAEASLSEERILSLAQGSDSVVFRLVTPKLIAASEQVDSGDLRDTVIRSHPPRSANKLRLTVSIGPVAIALSPIHARSLLSLSSTLTNMQSVNKPANMSQDAPANTLDISCHIRSVTCLFLRSSSPYLTSQLTTNDPLHDFFLARSTPSQPPRVPHLRIQFDILEFRFSTVSSGITPHLSHATDSGSSTIPSASKHGFKASLADLSVFAISSNTGRGWSTSPVLISDLHLSTQYKRDTKYPSFEVVDWTKAGSSSSSGKVSQWRVRPLYGKRKSVDVNPSSMKKSPGTSHRPVLEARIVSTTSGHASIFEVDVIPLHLFIDVGLLQGAIGFIAALTASPIPFEQDHSCADHPLDTDESPPATPRARSFTGWQEDNSERERRRLENLVISDFTAREGNYSSSSVNCTLLLPYTYLLTILPSSLIQGRLLSFDSPSFVSRCVYHTHLSL
jgi:autophagy-related protein 2